MIISKKSSMFLISIILSLFVHTGAYADILYSAASNGLEPGRFLRLASTPWMYARN